MLEKAAEVIMGCFRVCASDRLVAQWGGGGEAQGGLNLPLLIPFIPDSHPVFVGSCLFAFFRLQNIVQCYIIFPFFFRFLPPWESRLKLPLLPPPVHPHPLFFQAPTPCPRSL